MVNSLSLKNVKEGMSACLDRANLIFCHEGHVDDSVGNEDPNIEMFLPHSISNRSTQVLGRGMDTHLRKHWIFVFSVIGLLSPQKRANSTIFLAQNV